MSQQTNDQTRSMAPIACPDWECPRPENLRCLRLNKSECWFSCSPSPKGVGRRREARLGPLRDGSVIAESEYFEKNVNLRRRRSVASCSMFFQHVIVNPLISSCSRSLSSIRRVVHNCSPGPMMSRSRDHRCHVDHRSAARIVSAGRIEIMKWSVETINGASSMAYR